jgi:hypothetical protein
LIKLSNARLRSVCGHTSLLPELPAPGTIATGATDSTPGTEPMRSIACCRKLFWAFDW